MVRICKKPKVRQAEIVAAAKKIFFSKGVANTSISDIVKDVGVAQGTFYWHFKSKQEVINAVVKEMLEDTCSQISGVNVLDIRADEKIIKIRDQLFESVLCKGEIIDYFHSDNNIAAHDQFTKELASRLIPIICEIIMQGKSEGIFEVDYPMETAVFIFGMAHIINEAVVCNKEMNCVDRWKEALTDVLFKALGCS